MAKHLWYISKYTILPNLGNATRQYFISKYLQRRGYEVSLVSSRSAILNTYPDMGDQGFIEYKMDGFSQFLLKGPKVELGLSLKRIWSWIYFEHQVRKWAGARNERPEVIIVSSLSILTFLTGIFFKRKYNCKLIVEVRDIYPFTLIEIGNFNRSNPLIKALSWIEKKAYQKADHIVGTLPNLGEHIREVAPGSEDKFVHIPIGYDPEFFDQSEQKVDINLQLPSDKFIVGYFGSFGKAQATEIIFRAIRELRENALFHFLLVGDGPEKKHGMKLIEGLGNHTVLVGVPKKQVAGYIKLCDLVLNPWLKKSVYKYGVSPNKWIDYMWSAKPILVSFDGYQRIISECNCGWVIPAEDIQAFVQALNDIQKYSRAQLREMGMNGKNYLEQHLTYEKHAESIHRLIQE